MCRVAWWHIQCDGGGGGAVCSRNAKQGVWAKTHLGSVEGVPCGMAVGDGA
jgi:hypothetical protein